MAEVLVKPKSKPTLMPEQLGLSEHKRRDWVAEINPKLQIDEILEPAFWAHTAGQMQPLDLIEARWEDGTRIVHLRVRYAEKNYAKVKVISVEELGSVINEIPEALKKHKVEWKGPILKWCAIRLSDMEIVSNKHESRELCNKWVVDHEA